MKKLLPILFVLIITSCSDGGVTSDELTLDEKTKEVFMGLTVTKNGVIFNQDTDEPITGIIKKYYESGQLKSSSHYINGKPNGLFEKFFENGQLEESIIYTDGKKKWFV